jgi:hypothetical protein
MHAFVTEVAHLPLVTLRVTQKALSRLGKGLDLRKTSSGGGN